MASLKEKIAALRAKRSARPTFRPPGSATSNQILPMSQILHATTKTKEIELSDEDEDDDEDGELIVLPPPSLHAGAQRQLWKQKEVKRARERVAKSMAGNYEKYAELRELPTEVCTEDDDEVDKKEEDVDTPMPDDEGRDEEELALEAAEKEEGYLSKEVNGEVENAGNELTHEKTDTVQPSAGKSSSNITATSPQNTTPPEPAKVIQHSNELFDEQLANQGSSTASPERNSSIQGHDETRNTKTISRVIIQEQETKNHDEPSSAKHNLEPPSKNLSAPDDFFIGMSKRVTDSKPAEGSSFAGALIETEAEHDENESEDGLPVQTLTRDEEKESPADHYGPDEDDTSPTKMAAFHHKWVIENDSRDAHDSKTGSRSAFIEDGDDAVDFDGFPAQQNTPEENDDDQSEIDERQEQFDEQKRHRSSNYIDEMFLRDDSRSHFCEDAVEDGLHDHTDRTSRDKARALWKVRKKLRMSLIDEDENSLSRLDLFGDADRSRSVHFRMKFENACRSVPAASIADARQNGNTNAPSKSAENKQNPRSGDRNLPEWERRKACMLQKTKKRERSVSVGNWSFDAHGDGKRAEDDGVKSISSRGMSLGATCLSRRSRSRSLSGMRKSALTLSRKKVQNSAEASKQSTTFRGILGVLGARAKSDV